MKTRFSHLIILAICAAALAGCGGDKNNKRSDKERSARVAVRAEEVRKRLDDLQHSLVQLYQETEIQQMKIRAAQENLAALRKSLGELARSERAYLETSATGSAAIEVPRLKYMEEPRAPETNKKRKENRALETLLLLAFAAFLVTIGYKLYQKKSRSEEEVSAGESGDSYTIIKPPADQMGESEAAQAPEKVEPPRDEPKAGESDKPSNDTSA